VTWQDITAKPKDDFPTDMTQTDIDPADAIKPDDLKTFYRRVRSKIIAKRIENGLTMTSWKTLFSKRKHFTWTHANGTARFDGPAMLQILISSVNLSTRVGVSDLKSWIHSTKLVQFQYNVVDMCNIIMTSYELINKRGGCHDDIFLDLYDALLSGKNDVFNRFVERSKDNWEVGTEKTHDELVSQAVTKYNSRVKQGYWKQVEPKDATIVAITTQITNLEKKISPGTLSGKSNATNFSNPRSEPKFTLEDWCIVNNGKEKVVNGKTWHWCPHHKMKGVYDGMYVGHPEDENDEWLERKKRWKKKKGTDVRIIS